MVNILRKWWVWPIIFVAIVAIVFTLLPAGSSTVDRPLTEFIEDARAGRVRSVEVHDSRLEYKLTGDDQTFEAEMEESDTLREVLQDSGIEPQDFPPIKVKEMSFWAKIPGILFAFLPLIIFIAIIYFVVRAATGGRGSDKTRDIDPVCGKRVPAAGTAPTSTFQDIAYRFCSPECKQRFDADPVSFLLKR